MMWVHRIGNHWKRIAEILGAQFKPRSRLEIKNRAKFLMDQIANEMALNTIEMTPFEDKQEEEEAQFDQ
jgi:protein-disulfide isomerase-like protein with CxxC motif